MRKRVRARDFLAPDDAADGQSPLRTLRVRAFLFCASASALAISSRLSALRAGGRPCGPCGSELRNQIFKPGMVRSATSGPQGHAPAPQVPRSEAEGTAPRTNRRRPVRNTQNSKKRPELRLGAPALVSCSQEEQGLAGRRIRERRENPRPANSVMLSCRRALRARRCRGR